MQSFLSRFGSLILCVLSGFDRLRFRGDSRLLNHVRGVDSYLWQQHILRKDFVKHAEQRTHTLRQGTEDLARTEGVPIQHLNSPNTNKEADALALARAKGRSAGRIALLTCVESCLTYRPRKDDAGLLVLRKEQGRCLHYYHYFQHPRVGLCYVRVQSWFPFPVPIGLNGREWLYRQLQQRGIDFRRRKHVPAQGFGGCTGEVKIDLRQRVGGTRLKFWYHSNSLKIYDKEGQALRVETTINQPGRLQVYRPKEGAAEDAPSSWQQMRKGVADLHRQAQVSNSANERLLHSLASVAQTMPLGKLLEPLSQPAQTSRGRRVRALNPLAGADGALLRCLARGEFLLQGFRNRDVRAALHTPTADPDERRRQTAAVGRKLALLQAHGILYRVQKTHRSQLSAQGTRITTALLAAYARDVNSLATPP